MRIRMLVSLLIVAAASPLSAQSAVESSRPQWIRPQLALEYNWVQSNTPAGACGCFSLNGGSASLAWPVEHWNFAPAFDYSLVQTGSAATAGKSYSLTLATYTAGGRYFLPLRGRLRPFGEALIGFAHASGSLVAPPNPAASNAGLAFAAKLGGGLDLRVTHRFAIRLVEADYLATTFDNNGTGGQNNVQLAAGVVLHF